MKNMKNTLITYESPIEFSCEDIKPEFSTIFQTEVCKKLSNQRKNIKKPD